MSKLDRTSFRGMVLSVAMLPDNEQRERQIKELNAHNNELEDRIQELQGSPTFAETSWCADDLTETYRLTTKEAEAWLKEHETELNEAMVSGGWDCIRTLIEYEVRDEA